MKTNILGYPRVGSKRELKKASEKYWKGIFTADELVETSQILKRKNWLSLNESGIDLIPSNDFSFYDQVLDMSLTLGCIPKRFQEVQKSKSQLDLYFAMAKGIQDADFDITAMEMTKWFDTNYHYIVPEFEKEQEFTLFSNKIVAEYKEALELGIKTKPVIIGPVTYLLLGKEKESGFHRIELLEKLIPVYIELLKELSLLGVEYIQFEEPCCALNLTEDEQKAIVNTYTTFSNEFPDLKVIFTSYFDCYGDNLETILSLPIHALHLDLVCCPSQLEDILTSKYLNKNIILSLGIIDGRNVWKKEY